MPRWGPVVVVLGLSLAATGGASSAAGTGGVARPLGASQIPVVGGTAPVAGYRWPVSSPPRVLTPFAPPAHRFGAGHLGVDLAAALGQVVTAAGAGRVVFAGAVAGRGVVVVVHPDGVRTEYEPLRPSVRVGAQVAAGAPIGRVAGRHAACAPASCLHWGARRGDTYLDPVALLAPLAPVRLLPWTSTRG